MRYSIDEIKQALRDYDKPQDIAAALGVSIRTVQRWKSRLRRAEEDSLPEFSGTVQAPDRRRVLLYGRRFVFTCAQNNTPVHQRFFGALQEFCRDKAARLVVAPITYNKEGFQNIDKTRDGLLYDSCVERYFLPVSAEVSSGSDNCTPLVWCGELDILPTAVRPLTGLESYTREASAIIPHTKLAMQSVATLSDKCKFLYTTGTCTLRNYIQRKTGQKADFHHTFGALYVELLPNGSWFVRQLVASESGDFYDLDKHYTAEGVTNGHAVAAVTLGDMHAPRHDPVALGAAQAMLEVLQPKYVILHDVLDFFSRSHWNIKDVHFMHKAQHAGTKVQDEVQAAANLIQNLKSALPRSTIKLAPSNHPYALYKWLQNPDGAKDFLNAMYWHHANLLFLRGLENYDADLDSPFLLRHLLNEHGAGLEINDVLGPKDSLVVQGVELGMHGHLGPNGARGSVQNLNAVGKCTIGHVHAASIRDGVFSAGVTSKLDLDYNRGPSNWSHSHVVQYKNGKRCIVSTVGYDWR